MQKKILQHGNPHNRNEVSKWSAFYVMPAESYQINLLKF